jgi:hypothetical protein
MSWMAMLTVCLPLSAGEADCIRFPFRPTEGGMVWTTEQECKELIGAITALVDQMLAAEGWPEAEIRHARCELPGPGI